MLVFKMRDSVPSASYSSVCNVLRQRSISLISTYRVGYYSMGIMPVPDRRTHPLCQYQAKKLQNTLYQKEENRVTIPHTVWLCTECLYHIQYGCELNSTIYHIQYGCEQNNTTTYSMAVYRISLPHTVWL